MSCDQLGETTGDGYRLVVLDGVGLGISCDSTDKGDYVLIATRSNHQRALDVHVDCVERMGSGVPDSPVSHMVMRSMFVDSA